MKKEINEGIKKEVLFLRIPTELNNKLIKHVSKIGISKTAFICNLLYETLESRKEFNFKNDRRS